MLEVPESRAEGDRLLHQEYWQTRDPQLRDRLVERHAGLATMLSSRFSRSRDDRDDVRQVAMMGLLHAIERYDPHRGVHFTTFAWVTILGELKRYQRDYTWAVRVPRHLQEVYLRTAAALDELTARLGRSPTMAEISEATGDSIEDVVAGTEVRMAHTVSSLDTAADPEGPLKQLGGEDLNLENVLDRSSLSPLVARLPERQQRILHLRFVREMTQTEIGAQVGLSQMHVSRLLDRSLRQLREWSERGDRSA